MTASPGRLSALLRRAGALALRVPRAGGAALALAWMAGIAWLSSLPASGLPPAPLGAFTSNLAHAFLFGMLAFWAALALPRSGGWPRLGAGGAALVLAWVALYGALDEWHQAWSPGRSPSAFDLVTDVVGAASVLWIARTVAAGGAPDRVLAARLAACLAACAAAAGLATRFG